MIGEIRYLYQADTAAILLSESEDLLLVGYCACEGHWLGTRWVARRFWDRYWRVAA